MASRTIGIGVNFSKVDRGQKIAGLAQALDHLQSVANNTRVRSTRFAATVATLGDGPGLHCRLSEKIDYVAQHGRSWKALGDLARKGFLHKPVMANSAGS